MVVKLAYRRFLVPLLLLLAVFVLGTVGYRWIGGTETTWVDAFYMTFITVATIGYNEIIDMSGQPGARLFTVLIAATGISITTFILSTLTAFILEGDMNQALRRRKMQKRIEQLKGHFILCGAGRVGSNVAHELSLTERTYVVVDIAPEQIAAHVERYPNVLYLTGDASEDEVLLKAGIERAAGVFAVTGDDSKNLVITLTAKQLNPACRLVARCHELNYFSKMQKVGADAIVSPDFTGGMRIVSSMIRPQVVSFLDQMLRSDNNVRVEEVSVPATAPSWELSTFAPPSREYIVLAVKEAAATLFNPEAHHTLKPGSIVVVMATPAGRHELERRAAARAAEAH